MINVCMKYEFIPPDFLFSMAKAFVCLNGISNFSNNNFTAKELLQAQTVEYLLKRSFNDCKEIVLDSLNITPKIVENTMQYGFINTVSKVITGNKIENDIKKSIENLKEIKDLLMSQYLN